ncbi:MAG TPA: GH3 auxin-responsive promoter family protein [Thermoanaerobaculia bacterium]
MRVSSILANGAWLLSSLPSAFAFRANLHRVAEVQQEVLLRILRRNAETMFGRAHRFRSIASVQDYQQCVPVRTYDEYPELRDPRLLVSSPVIHVEPTSGSSGATKRIPYTRELRAEFERAIAPWIVDLFTSHPAAFAGEAYWSLSPVTSDGQTAADEDHLGPLRARLVRMVQAVPRDVRLHQDLDVFRRSTLLHLIRCRTLSLISVWHPSFLSLLMAPLREMGSSLAVEIGGGRGAEVRSATSLADDGAMHAALWPRLRVISCWADAGAASGAAHLSRLFPQASVVPKGLLSTEGFISFPLLAYRSHFYELRCAESGEVIPASQARTGGRYGVILTTGAGLYRYDTEDLVELTGFRDTCPILRFVGRANHLSDHFGEKLNELFVREHLARALESAGAPASFAMLACEERSYALFVESDATDAQLLSAADALERSLRENIHYDYCRRLGQLEELTLFRIARDGATTYLTSSGQRLGDVKLGALDGRRGWGGRFEGRWVKR